MFKLGVSRRARQSVSVRGAISRKLTFLTVASVGAATVVVAGMAVWQESRRFMGAQYAALQQAADIFSTTSAQALADNNRSDAQTILRAVNRSEAAIYSAIETNDGRIFADMGLGVRLESDLHTARPVETWSIQELLTTRTLTATAPIIRHGETIGRVVMVRRADNMAPRLFSTVMMTALAGALALIIGLLVARRMQRSITHPIQDLTAAMQRIQADHDYSAQVTTRGDGEVAILVDGFNAMLSEIAERDARIEAHVRTLEDEVAARTQDYRVARDAAESANAAKSDFLATMSHEIRTPMNGVMVMAELLAQSGLADKHRRYADVIVRSGRNLLAIINDILDLSKIEAGKLTLEDGDVDLAAMADDVAALFAEKAREKGVELVAFTDPKSPRRIVGDPVRLGQVVSNLVSNALKFTESGSVLLRIEPDGPSHIRILVRDTGIGIPPDKLATVFQAFSQADQTTTRRFGGTGLGLTISRRLVDAMGGAIDVASEVGKGSTFTIRLPVRTLDPPAWPHVDGGAKALLAISGRLAETALARLLQAAGLDPRADHELCDTDNVRLIVADAAKLEHGKPNGLASKTVAVAPLGDTLADSMVAAGRAARALSTPLRREDVEDLLARLSAGVELGAPAPSQSRSGASDVAFPKARVLVADDSPVNLEVASEALRQFAITPRTVSDGRQAVDLTAQEEFDLVLMDASMPVLDGFGAARAIRAREAGGPRLPIVALTAHVLGAGADAWRDAGMDGILSKPFTLDDLGACLLQHLPAHLRAAPVSRTEPVDNPAPAPQIAPQSAPAPQSDLLNEDVIGQLRQMAGSGRSDFVDRVLGLYRENAPKALADLQAAVAAADWEGAARAAHAVKSMSLNIGAQAVAEAAAAMERRVRIEGGAIPSQDAAELSDLYARTQVQLGAHLQASASPAPIAPSPRPAARDAEPPASDADAQLLADLRAALAADALELAYQPIVDRRGDTIIGVEALARWRHASLGQISPGRFVPLAERHGLATALGEWVMRRALRETANWRCAVSVNISALHIQQTNFVENVSRWLKEADVDPAKLIIEVTETAFIGDDGHAESALHALQGLGVKLALDDFGSGYSSLMYVRRFPFNKIKVDREFVSDIGASVDAAAIIHAVVAIGRALGKEIIAEGVETAEQHAFLRAAGVHGLQGYLFGRPMTPHALGALLDAQTQEHQAHSA